MPSRPLPWFTGAQHSDDRAGAAGSLAKHRHRTMLARLFRYRIGRRDADEACIPNSGTRGPSHRRPAEDRPVLNPSSGPHLVTRRFVQLGRLQGKDAPFLNPGPPFLLQAGPAHLAGIVP